MQHSRKNALESLRSVYVLKNKHEKLKNSFISLTGEAPFQQCIKYYNELIDKLKDQINVLPIGFRYVGIFYIKKSYTLELEFVKYEGSLYMREDLVSWEIEKGRNGNESYLNRFVYREPFLDAALIKKGDTDIIPVFATQEESIA